MVRVFVSIEKNELPRLAAAMPSVFDRAARKQVLVSEGDVKGNIVKYDAIDTGNMLGSVRGDTGAMEVSVSAESEGGYPYPTAVNYGTIHVPPRPFFTEAENKARQEFLGRVKTEVEGELR